MSRLNFKLEAKASGSQARAATFRTLHNEVKSPLFMPVGTQATVRSQTIETLEGSGSQILLANTYHLLLRPGPEVFEKAGGIHKFMNWKKSVLTDSGGFQIFSLPHSRKMTEEGAEFQSYVDGQRIKLTPELSIGMQKLIGSDIMMVLDQCIDSTSDYGASVDAMNLTHRWAKRSLAARGDSPQSLFAIVQGACFEDLRKQSAAFLTELPFDGFAIGGLAVGETKALREDFTELTAKLLPEHLPRYLMGVGTPIDLLEAVHRGVDMFDCILPTALAQQGVAYTSMGRLLLRRGVYRLSDQLLDPNCKCSTCTTYSRAYLHHLIKTKEFLGWQLIATHNLHFYHGLMREMRESILNDTFSELYQRLRPQLQLEDEENPSRIPKMPRVRKRILGDYEVHLSAEGFASIRQLKSGEIMHSVNDPVEEARKLYVEQSRLLEKLSPQSGKLSRPLVIWDVGLGAATNAMAAIHAVEAKLKAGDVLRPLQIISFENDLDSLKLAAKYPPLFRYLQHSAPHILTRNNEWSSKDESINWKLLEGDFLARVQEAPLPDLIYFDPFSYKTDTALWTVECFTQIFSQIQDHAVELFTYSGSTAVRAALLASGFYVAKGIGTGPKADTTIALTPRAASMNGFDLLGAEWLERWSRSESKFPAGAHQESFENLIRSHPQFQA